MIIYQTLKLTKIENDRTEIFDFFDENRYEIPYLLHEAVKYFNELGYYLTAVDPIGNYYMTKRID